MQLCSYIYIMLWIVVNVFGIKKHVDGNINGLKGTVGAIALPSLMWVRKRTQRKGKVQKENKDNYNSWLFNSFTISVVRKNLIVLHLLLGKLIFF